MPSNSLEELVRWAKSQGAHLHDMVEVYDDEQYGIAIKVRDGKSRRATIMKTGLLPAKSRIVSCPFTLSLSYLNALSIFPALQSHSPRFPLEFLNAASPQIIGNFFLIQQYLMGQNSFWFSYIRSLPQPDEHEKLGTPLYFADADLEWIQGTNLELAREERERMWMTEWCDTIPILDKDFLFTNSKEAWTFSLYKWAATIFSSRSFVSNLIPREVLELSTIAQDSGIELAAFFRDNAPDHLEGFFKDPFPVLFPLVDLANHSSAAKVTWFSNAHDEPRDLSIIIDSDIPPGNQIFNNYAPKSNTELFLGYGFCLPGNDEVAIQFMPLDDDLLTLRKRQLSIQQHQSAPAGQRVFHVRREPYQRPENDKRLPDFERFEDGFVDTVALCVANQREILFWKTHPEHRLETSTDTVFAGPLARNALHVISVLHERMEHSLTQILLPRKHLGIPTNSSQRVAEIYRDGQIATLRLAIIPLEKRLALYVFPTSDDHIETRANLRVLTLRWAYDLLASAEFRLWEVAKDAICSELEVESMDWHELVSGEWDFVLWCLWIYVAGALHFFSQIRASVDALNDYTKHLLQFYSNGFETSPFQTFQGETDERETLEAMISKIDILVDERFDADLIMEKGGAEAVNRRLLALASTVVQEECFPITAETAHANGSTYPLKQRVLCILDKPAVVL